MEIAIIAHDLKKELMAQFCIAYCGVLANHHICATASTAQYISEATGLQIDRLMSGEHGGEQQIARGNQTIVGGGQMHGAAGLDL